MAVLSTDTVRQPFLKTVTERLRTDFPEESFSPETLDYRYTGITLSVQDSAVKARYLNGGYKATVSLGIWYTVTEDTEAARFAGVSRVCGIIDHLESIRLTLPEGYTKGSFLYRKAPELKKRNNLGHETYMAEVEMTYVRL